MLGCPVLLCTWHATKAWLEQLRNKLRDKSRFREAFDTLHNIMLLKATGTREQRLAALDASITNFEEAFKKEDGKEGVLAWFRREWKPKLRAQAAYCRKTPIACCQVVLTAKQMTSR